MMHMALITKQYAAIHHGTVKENSTNSYHRWHRYTINVDDINGLSRHRHIAYYVLYSLYNRDSYKPTILIDVCLIHSFQLQLTHQIHAS